MRTKPKYRFIGFALALAAAVGLAWLLFPKPDVRTPESAFTAHPAPDNDSPRAAMPGLKRHAAAPRFKSDLDETRRTALRTELLERVAKEKDPLEHAVTLAIMVKGYSRDQLNVMLELARSGSLEPLLAQYVRFAVVDRWFEIDPAEAIKRAASGLVGGQAGNWLVDQKLEQCSEPQQEMLLATLLRVWARGTAEPGEIIARLETQQQAGRLNQEFLDRAMNRL